MHVSARYMSSLGYLKKKEPEKASAAEQSPPIASSAQRLQAPILRVLQEELQKKSQLCIPSSFSLFGAGPSTE